MPAPRLSLCMIVRDEAAMLPAFLGSVEGLWDELVAVDTGSEDDTAELLAQAGARVLRRPWDDDFAAARNAGLDAATGDWVLVLDADERVSEALGREIRALLDDEEAGAATMTLRSPFPRGDEHEARLLRLFRREPGVRFVHRVREDASRSVAEMLARTGRRVVPLAGTADHLGYVRDPGAVAARRERDLRLVERAIAESPDDLDLHLKRLGLARYWEDEALFARAAAEAAAALARVGPEPLRSSPYGGELLALVAEGLHPGDPEGALAWLEDWQERAPATPAFLFHRGLLREQLGQHEAAEADYRGALAAGGRPYDTGEGAARPRLGLARLALVAGDLDRALGHLRDALEEAPHDAEAVQGMTRLLEALAGDEAATGFAEEHLAAHGPSPVLAQILAERALARGDGAEALRHLEGQVIDPPAGRAALLEAMAHLVEGDARTARALAEALVPRMPEAGLGVLACNLALGEDTDLVLDLTQEEADDAFRDWVDVALAGRDTALTEAFLAALPSVLEVFPWLPDHLAEALEALEDGEEPGEGGPPEA